MNERLANTQQEGGIRRPTREEGAVRRGNGRRRAAGRGPGVRVHAYNAHAHTLVRSRVVERCVTPGRIAAAAAAAAARRST